MSHSKSKPGPRRKSCRTCWQRRKKCDLSRPQCQRCLKGGFKCLGYREDDSDEYGNQADPDVPAPTQPRYILPAVSTQTASLELGQAPSFIGLPEGSQHRNSTSTNDNLGSLAMETASLYDLTRPVSVARGNCAVLHPWEDFDRLWPQEQRRITTQDLSTRSNNGSDTIITAKSGSNCLSKLIEGLRWSLPPPINSTQILWDGHFANVVYEYRFQRSTLWFMCPPAPIRDFIVEKLRASKTMTWTMWLGTRLFQSINQDPRSAAVRECIGWIDKLDQGFSTDSCSDPPLDDVADRLLAQLELAYLKFTTVDCISGYNLLQRALPRFLQVAAADENLNMEHPNGNLVLSFSRTLNSLHHELQRFMLYDTAAAFVLGTPPLVEYGYDTKCDHVSHEFEWIHGVPFALNETISQINSWRAGSRVAPLDDWQEIERRVQAWQPQIKKSDEEDSATRAVARLAVQESWRHVVLIYLYMGMCGVSSHDTRVQASIRQIIRLGETVADLPIGIHMFTHCLIVGIGARLEKHRSLVRKKLLSFKGTRVWLFRGPQFSKVLDHLWHGAGAGGAPVMWDDYIQSRCKVIPI